MSDPLLDLVGIAAPEQQAPATPQARATPAQDPLLSLVGAAPDAMAAKGIKFEDMTANPPPSDPGAMQINVRGLPQTSKAPAPTMQELVSQSWPARIGDAATGFGRALSDNIKDVPHQVGLTARYGIEGVGGALDFLASPIRGAINLFSDKGAELAPANFKGVADALGLPTPQSGAERVVGDATRMLAGAAVPMGAASRVAQGASGVTKAVAQTMAANPAQQFGSAAAAGGAGGYTRETGGDDTAQLIASLGAGLATPYAMGKAQQLGDAAKTMAQSVTGAGVPQSAQIDIQVNNALKDSGMTMADLPYNVQSGIRSDVQQAMKTSGVLSPDAIRRLADYRLTGTTPTAATLTLDPAMVSQQKNLAKMGINSKDPVAQQLGQTENANNRQLIAGLNDLGASTTDDAVAGGQRVMGALNARNTAAKSLIDQQYAAARATAGRDMPLDPNAFTNTANDMLDEALLGGKLPSDVRNLLNKAADGSMPLTVDTAEQFKTRIGDLQRASTEPSERKALGLVRQALDSTPLLDGGQGLGQESINAFNKARSMNRMWMGIVDKTPALQAVRDGIEPDKFVQQFIIGNGGNANVMDVAALKSSIKGSPDAMAAVRGQITAYLKKAALNSANDEVGNFSQSAYNKALGAVGDRKLQLFFPQDDINQMKAIGRVASYEQFQPKGSAVGNSNTAATGLSAILDRIGSSPLLSKIPFGKSLAEPAQNISIGIKSGRAMDVPSALGWTPAPRRAPLPILMSPAALMLQQQDDKQK